MPTTGLEAKTITVYVNGDVYNEGKRFVVSSRTAKNFEQVLKLLTQKLSMPSATAVQKLYSLKTWKRIYELGELENGAIYVATQGEPPKKVPYKLPEKRSMTNLTRQITLRKMQTDRAMEKVEKEPPIFGPSSKAYRVFIYPNGDAGRHPIQLPLNYRNCRHFFQVLNEVTNILRIGDFCSKLYDIDNGGKPIKSLGDLRNGQRIAAGSDHYKKLNYPEAKLTTSLENLTVSKENPPVLITVYPNGDFYHTGLSVAVTTLKFPTLKKLFSYIDRNLTIICGRVTYLYTLHGGLIRDINSLQHNREYIVAGPDEPFIKGEYNRNRNTLDQHSHYPSRHQSVVDEHPTPEVTEPPKQIKKKETDKQLLPGDTLAPPEPKIKSTKEKPALKQELKKQESKDISKEIKTHEKEITKETNISKQQKLPKEDKEAKEAKEIKPKKETKGPTNTSPKDEAAEKKIETNVKTKKTSKQNQEEKEKEKRAKKEPKVEVVEKIEEPLESADELRESTHSVIDEVEEVDEEEDSMEEESEIPDQKEIEEHIETPRSAKKRLSTRPSKVNLIPKKEIVASNKLLATVKESENLLSLKSGERFKSDSFLPKQQGSRHGSHHEFSR